MTGTLGTELGDEDALEHLQRRNSEVDKSFKKCPTYRDLRSKDADFGGNSAEKEHAMSIPASPREMQKGANEEFGEQMA